MRNGFEFSYKSDKVQLKFLQLLSTDAVQNITYHCKNSIAYYDRKTKTHERAATFMTSNDLELVADKPIKARYTVLKDECQYGKRSWAETVFEFKTGKTQRLPILDIAPYFDATQTSQGFGLEIGPACFS